VTRIRLFAVLALLVLATATGAAVSNEPPLADAGLDQTATRGTTVYLDAGGSRDPDGNITAFNWTIQTPAGTTTQPDCPSCERTHFRADATGTFEVTVTVTDDDGATATDTLYVDVTAGDPPDATLAGPNTLDTGQNGTYSATLGAGAAPLDRAVWYVDGDRTATKSVSGDAATVEQTVRFPANGSHDVRIVTIDADGQRADATRQIDVTTPVRQSTHTESNQSSGAGGTSDGSQSTGGSTGSSDATSTTSGTNPDITGPTVVTGDEVLTATYRLAPKEEAQWYLDGDPTHRSSIASYTLSPGRHELYALPEAGGVARFQDGSRTVVADPAPDVTVDRIVEESVVTVDAYATDELDNLQSLTVLVDGEPRKTVSASGLRERTAGSQLTTLSRLASLEPGDHTLTVRATDTRGQTDSKSRQIHVPGPPEVVSAGFVNDEPLSVYHPKLDPDRYTAKYRVKIDLNGVKPERVISDGAVSTRATKIAHTRNVDQDSNLVLITDFYHTEPENISASHDVLWDIGKESHQLASTQDTTVIDESKPVIRLNLLYAQNNAGETPGEKFDASESFDPDDTGLKYRWITGDGSIVKKGPEHKLSAIRATKLQIEDGQGQINETAQILDWFVPEIEEARVLGDSTYLPNETVTFRVRTQDYELAKSTYADDIGLELNSDHGTVGPQYRNGERVNSGNSDEIADRPGGDSFIVHSWNVSVPAEEFLQGEPTVILEAADNPRASREFELPRPVVLRPVSTQSHVQSLDRRFLIRKQQYDTRSTADPDVRTALQSVGYEVRSIRETGTEYHLEKRVKTQSAAFETEQREFASMSLRDQFLGGHPAWSSGGSETQTKEWTTTETEWRSSKSGSGTYTGRTRQHMVEPAEYETQREYEYRTKEEYTKTETYQVTKTKTVTETVIRERCTALGGCREVEVEVTKTVETTVTKTRTVEATRWVTETYWASRPRSAVHDRTGNRREVKVADATYERQYEFETEQQHRSTQRVYLAENTVQVQSPEYDWQQYDVALSERAASMQATQSDIRIGHTEPTKRWILRQEDGTHRELIEHASEPNNVIQTVINATVVVQTKLRDPRDGLLSTTVKQQRVVALRREVEGYIKSDSAEKYASEVANETHGGYE
jgi:hypothetical protein